MELRFRTHGVRFRAQTPPNWGGGIGLLGQPGEGKPWYLLPLKLLGDPLIDKLELLLALAKERHFGRAAEACGVTQPTMSTSLKQLEEILGVMLVQRGSRFQGFTPEGERTLDWARRIVGDARAMRQEINSLKDNLSGEIRIAAIPTVLGMVASHVGGGAWST
jgi:DNA-binding transcriptional ArsR family regulator